MKVPDIQFIRQLYEREGWSVRRIAREFHFSRKTVTKYLDRQQPTETPQYTRRQPAAAPQMDRYHAIITQWLEEDQTAPRKQRHTSRRIWQRLRDEYGAQVAESTVRHFVARLRRDVAPGEETSFLDLVFDPGEAAQVDWGEAQIDLDGRRVKAQIFCMRLAHSGACFVQLFPHQRLEAFLAAHAAAFRFFGFIPRDIIYDNLTTAVRRILRGRGRDLNARFAELAAHYVFRPVFATPASGWEKGLVEGLVGYARRTFLVPVPVTVDWASINRVLEGRCQDERLRVLPRRGENTVGTLWDAERAVGLALPAATFRAATHWTVRVSKQALVRHLGVAYSVPTAFVGRTVSLYAYWDHIELWTTAQQLAWHPLGKPHEGPQLQLDHYLDVLRHKPGAVRNARVVRELGPLLRAYQDAFFRVQPEAYAAFVDILFLFRRFPAEQILAALPAAQAARCFTAEGLHNRLATLPSCPPATPDPHTRVPRGPRIEQPNPAVYGQLVAGVRES